MTSNDEYVIQILIERGFLTQDQVDAAAKSMKAENETTLDVLVSGGTIGEDEVLGTVADQFGLKYCHVNADAINPEVVKKIPADTVIVSIGYTSDQTLYEAIKDEHVHLLGDAEHPGNPMTAIWGAYTAALNI